MSYTVTATDTTIPYVYTTTGTGGYTISPNVYDTILSTSANPNTLNVKGDAEFEGDVKIKGKSINETLEKIEEKLAILHPNEELEKKWEELRSIRQRYLEVEAEIIEKEKMWAILKK